MSEAPAEKSGASPQKLLPEGKKLSPEEVLERRVEEGDTQTFFTGGDVKDRLLGQEEKVAFGEIVKDRVSKGKAKVVHFNFGDKPTSGENGSSSK